MTITRADKLAEIKTILDDHISVAVPVGTEYANIRGLDVAAEAILQSIANDYRRPAGVPSEAQLLAAMRAWCLRGGGDEIKCPHECDCGLSDFDDDNVEAMRAALTAAETAPSARPPTTEALRLADDLEAGELGDLNTEQTQLIIRSLRAGAPRPPVTLAQVSEVLERQEVETEIETDGWIPSASGEMKPRILGIDSTARQMFALFGQEVG